MSDSYYHFEYCLGTFKELLNALNDVNVEEELKWDYIEDTLHDMTTDMLSTVANLKDEEEGRTLLAWFVVRQTPQNYGSMYYSFNWIVQECPETVQEEDNNNCIALHHVIRNAHSSSDMISLIFKAWPEAIMKQNDDGLTPLQLASSGIIKLVNTITLRTYGYSTLHIVTMHENISVEMIALILNSRPEATMILDRNGNTPLHYAVQNKNVSINQIKCLLHSSKDAPEVRNRYNQSPLHLAALNQDIPVDLLELLVTSMGKELLGRDTRNHTPLHSAVYSFVPSIDSIYFLLKSCPEVIKIE